MKTVFIYKNQQNLKRNKLSYNIYNYYDKSYINTNIVFYLIREKNVPRQNKLGNVYFSKTCNCHDTLSTYECKDTVIHVNTF